MRVNRPNNQFSLGICERGLFVNKYFIEVDFFKWFFKLPLGITSNVDVWDTDYTKRKIRSLLWLRIYSGRFAGRAFRIAIWQRPSRSDYEVRWQVQIRFWNRQYEIWLQRSK